jgi:threonyl-tRNA synthetase
VFILTGCSRIKAFKILKHSSSYFLGDQKNDSLQRIYGVSFPDKKDLKAHLEMLEEAAKRDHRRIGIDQELFFFDQQSPGSAFFLPHGMRIYNTLMAFLRSEYWNRGYQEVSSPNMFNSSLWKSSGHWQHYSEDMFVLDIEKEKWALKPMNCPGHCLIFRHRERSYRELPIRMAEFGVLHRNEASGALSGLTRVRRFVQDDTHVFCTVDQIGQEIEAIFEFFVVVYKALGLTFKLKLSTRPEGYIGRLEDWDKAEDTLKKSLDKFTSERGETYELNPGDGAFYGPKIDITVGDALNRFFQCATVQLDFQLPQRFGLEYVNGETIAKSEEPAAAPKAAAPAATDAPAAEKKDDAKVETKDPPAGYSRPVMIHRAIIGSFERMMGILTEHFGGKWPFWLSPRQILVVPVMPAENDYVDEIVAKFREAGFFADPDTTGKTMKQKIAIGQAIGYNFIFVVGPEEKKSGSVNMRNRDADVSNQKRAEIVPIPAAIEKLTKLRDTHVLEHKTI